MPDLPSVYVAGVAPQINDLVQDRTWERVFHDALFPALMFRADVMPSEWPANVGTKIAQTRTGLIPIVSKPLKGGTDPQPASYESEQWEATLNQFANSVDTNQKDSSVALASQFSENMQKLGLNSGQSLNHLARNNMYSAYLGGNTVVDLTASSTTTIHVREIAGFISQINLSGGEARPKDVSSTNPIRLDDSLSNASLVGRSVILAVADDADNDPWGKGTLTLDGTVSVTSGHSVVAANASFILRVGGAATVDGLTSSDIFTLQAGIDAIARIRQFNVPPHSDGLMHAHIDPTGEAELFNDPAWQRLNTALPDHVHYRTLAMGEILGAVWYRNTEVPNASSVVDNEFFPWKTVLASGIEVHRPIVTGMGAVYEKWLPETNFITEAGTTGKTGEFNVVNNSVSVMTDRVRLVMRAPIDRLQQIVSTSWSWSGDFAVPSDFTTGKRKGSVINARFKRCVAIEHA